MTVKMSSEGDSAKSAISEPNEKSGGDQTDSSQDSQDLKDTKNELQTENNIDKKEEEPKTVEEETVDAKEDSKKEDTEDEEVEKNEKPKNDIAAKENDKKKEDDKEEESEKEVEEEEEEEVDEEEEEEGEEEEEEEEPEEKEKPKKTEKPKKKEPVKETKNAKKPAKIEKKEDVEDEEEDEDDEEDEEDEDKTKNGSGTALGDIARVDASLSRFKTDDLKLLHKLIYDEPGKNAVIKKNILKFSGFDFKKGSDEYEEKVTAANEYEVKNLKSVCEMLDIQKTGSKDDIITRILDFLIEPKDIPIAPKTAGRPKRTAAVKANNRGYSSHDDYSSDERAAARGKRGKGARASLKDDSSESDEEFKPTRGGRKGKAASDEDISDASVSISEDSDDEPKSKRRRSTKVANSKPKGRGKARGRGRPSATPAKKTPAKRGRKQKKSETEESENSSSEDEPLAKKVKGKEPPKDDEIKAYVKKILEGANLEEITMNTVCQKVYSHYPDFDLAHKKDFIKSTVKSLIST